MKSWIKNKLSRTSFKKDRSGSDADFNFDSSKILNRDIQDGMIGRNQSVIDYVPDFGKYQNDRDDEESKLPADFAGRVLRLEMQVEKGVNYVTMDDINALMDLYTQAVEHYNVQGQPEKQSYYESKLIKLLKLPTLLKVTDKEQAKKKAQKQSLGVNCDDLRTSQYEDTSVKIFDNSITSPLYQFKKASNDDMMKLHDKRKEKNNMTAQIHQMSKTETKETAKVNDNLIEENQKMKRRATILINKDTVDQRESIQQRLAERKKRARAKMAETVVETSNGFDSMLEANQAQNQFGRQSVMLPAGSFVQGSFDTSVTAKKYKPKDNYLKDKINASTKGFGGLGLKRQISTPQGGSSSKGPKFGQSRIISGNQQDQKQKSGGFGSRSNISRGSSNQSIGGGLASRFTLALSKIIDKDSTTVDQEDSELTELFDLVEELNGHQDLTVKLNNQSKICNIFSKDKNSLLQKKIENKLLDPKILEILESNKKELQKYQEEKDEEIEELLDSLTEDRIMNQKKIEKDFKKIQADHESTQKEENGPDMTDNIASFKASNDENLKEAIEKFKQQCNENKREGLNKIKEKFNNLSQQVKLDSKTFVKLILSNKTEEVKAMEVLEQNKKQMDNENPLDDMEINMDDINVQ